MHHVTSRKAKYQKRSKFSTQKANATKMNPAVTNLVLMLTMMQVAKKLDFEDPQVLLYARVGYVACQVIALAVYLITRAKINSKNDMVTLEYVEPANPFGGEAAPKATVTTVKEYDLKQVDTQIKGIFTGMAMLGFMHLYMGYTNPLLMQLISTVKLALELNIVKIHVWGTPATGDLKRPFKLAPGFLQQFMGGDNEVKTDKQLVEAAEKAGAGGVKED